MLSSDMSNIESKKPESLLGSALKTLNAAAEQKQELTKSQIAWLRKTRLTNESARKLFDYLTFSEKHFKSNSVRFLEAETNCEYYEIVKLLKGFDSMGFGNFIVGRKGNDSRITWDFHPQSIGSVANRKSSTLYGVPSSLDSYDGGMEDEGLNEHSFLLRPELTIEIVLPHDFSKSDADRLSRWLQTIPFE